MEIASLNKEQLTEKVEEVYNFYIRMSRMLSSGQCWCLWEAEELRTRNKVIALQAITMTFRTKIMNNKFEYCESIHDSFNKMLVYTPCRCEN